MLRSVLSDWLAQFREARILQRILNVNIVVFVLAVTLMLIAKRSGNAGMLEAAKSVFYLAASADIPVLLLRPWSIITHMFTHYELGHGLFNMLMLYFSGQLFNRWIGEQKLLSTYINGGLWGLGLLLIIHNLSPAFAREGAIIGASAAVLAVLVSVSAYRPDIRINLFILGQVQLKYVVIFLLVADYAALLKDVNIGGHIGHLGGAIYGFVLGYRLRKGKDFGLWTAFLLSKLEGVFKKKNHLKVAYRRHPRYRSDEEFNAEKTAKKKRMDALLDKIARSGPQSLSEDERKFLEEYSKNI